MLLYYRKQELKNFNNIDESVYLYYKELICFYLIKNNIS